MVTICASCHRLIKITEGHKGLVSHGICPACAKALYPDISLFPFRCAALAHYENDFTADELIDGSCPLCGGLVFDTRLSSRPLEAATTSEGQLAFVNGESERETKTKSERVGGR